MIHAFALLAGYRPRLRGWRFHLSPAAELLLGEMARQEPAGA